MRICSEIREELEPEPAAAATAGAARRAAAPTPPATRRARIAGAIYVSCSGRGGPHFGAPSAELQIVRHALGDVPLVGFFAAGEIARHHLYGYTGVLHGVLPPACDTIERIAAAGAKALPRRRRSRPGAADTVRRSDPHDRERTAARRTDRGRRRARERQRAVVAALPPCCRRTRCCGSSEDTVPYECDGLTAYREQPLVVALPETEAQVAAVLRACHALDVPVVARGAGTGLSGGALPHRAGRDAVRWPSSTASSSSTRLARTAVVQCGVRNLAISEAAAPLGLYYAPDPSSQIACTIGGNVAENSGGVHCLKYGLTLHNVLRVRGFTVEGEAVEFGSEALDAPGSTCCRWSSAAKACWP